MVRTKRVTNTSRSSTRSSTRTSSRKRSAASKYSSVSSGFCDSDGFAVPAPVAPTLASLKRDVAEQFGLLRGEYEKVYKQQLMLIKRVFSRSKILVAGSFHKTLPEMLADYKPPPSETKSDLSGQTTMSSVNPSIMQDRTNLQYSSKSGKSQSILKPSQAKSGNSKGSDKSMFKQPVKTRNSLRLQQQQQQQLMQPPSVTKYVTPMNARPIPNMPAVTPKVNMNTPLSIIRRPRAGEFAMSITGSPLMVSSIPRDEIPSVCVPLPDGTVLSILPNQGLSSEHIPFLNEDLRAQLETLESNLRIIRGFLEETFYVGTCRSGRPDIPLRYSASSYLLSSR